MSKSATMPGKITGHSISSQYTLPLNAIQAQISFIQGRVLTIIDASFSSDGQNKAIKDLIRDVFRTQQNWIGSLATGSDNGGDLLFHSGVGE